MEVVGICSDCVYELIHVQRTKEAEAQCVDTNKTRFEFYSRY